MFDIQVIFLYLCKYLTFRYSELDHSCLEELQHETNEPKKNTHKNKVYHNNTFLFLCKAKHTKTKTNTSSNLYSQILSQKTSVAKTLDLYLGCGEQHMQNLMKNNNLKEYW